LSDSGGGADPHGSAPPLLLHAALTALLVSCSANRYTEASSVSRTCRPNTIAPTGWPYLAMSSCQSPAAGRRWSLRARCSGSGCVRDQCVGRLSHFGMLVRLSPPVDVNW